MRLYVSGILNDSIRNKMDFENTIRKMNILHSYAYNYDGIQRYYNIVKNLLIDSGAFSVMNAKRKLNNFNPIEYTKKYAHHIKENNIDNFIELDIDGVYGFEMYKDCLHILEDITGKRPIPVFHYWRGINYFNKLVEKYDYVAIGGIVTNEWGGNKENIFNYLIDVAHKNNCKVHGLGYTDIFNLSWIPFDSVDSASFCSGAKFARVSRFNGHNISMYNAPTTEVKKLIPRNDIMIHDFLEWKKLSEYFDKEY